MAYTSFVGIVAEDTMIVDVGLVDIEKVGIELMLVQLASACHSSSSRYPPSSLATTRMLCNPSHHVLHLHNLQYILVVVLTIFCK